MTTTNSLVQRDVFSIAGDMDNIHDYLRVTQEMVMDLLCDCHLDDKAALAKMHERIYLLVNQLPTKLAELVALNEKLMDVSRAEILPR